MSDSTMRDIVDVVFAQLRLTFGAEWDRMWADGVEMADGRDRGVELSKAHWTRELSIYDGQRYRLRYALDASKRRTRPPNLGDFRALCGMAPPGTGPVGLSPPRAEPDPRLVARLRSAVSGDPPEPLAWAKDPRSKVAMQFVVEGAKRGDGRLQSILRRLCESEHAMLTQSARDWYAKHGGGEK